MELFLLILHGIIVAPIPLVFAAIGELVVERAGVLNLGLEGMMILGAIAGFSVTLDSGSYVVGIAAAALAGAAAVRPATGADRAVRNLRMRYLANTSMPNRENRNMPWNTPVTALGRFISICAVSPPM